MRYLRRCSFKYMFVVYLMVFLGFTWTFMMSSLMSATRKDMVNDPCNTNLSQMFPPKNTSDVVRVTTNLTTEQYNDNHLNAVQYGITWFDAIHLAGTIRPKQGALTIGIPTVYRPKQSYLHTTLKSLITGMTRTERESVMCIVFLSGSNSTYASELALSLTTTFPKEFRSGFLRLITAPLDYYPSMDHLKITFNDTLDRVIWRSRQNLDYAFLVNYAKNLSTYYLQLEDDVVVSPHFLTKLFHFVHQQKHDWAVLYFSEIGFIGKFFKNDDLDKLALVLRVFFNEQPCDYLLKYFRSLLLQFEDVIYHPPLFKHIGHYSTLKDQIRNITTQRKFKMSYKDFGVKRRTL